MRYDFKNASWNYDINSFHQWKTFLERIKDRDGQFHEKLRERIRDNMRNIQQRWPQFIKVDEIP